jgi:FkbM family methyltransferase
MHKHNSFDVFDTLIGRICYKGTIIFDIIEQTSGIKNFANIRRECETVGIDNIYKKIQHVYPVVNMESLKELELKLEYDFSFPIWKYLNRVKPEDIFISDMYLSENQIYTLIKKHKHVDNKLIVSSGGKSSGEIWDNKDIVERIILHTGDNKISDYINPTHRNINAEWISNVDFNDIETEISKLSYELACCIRATRLTLQHEPDFMQEVCMLSFMPLVVLFSIYIKKQVDEGSFKEVIFLSRDGYWMYMMFNIFFPHIKSKYVYFSRLLSSNPIKRNEFITSININDDKKLIVDLYGSGKTINAFLDELKNTTYLLCFSWSQVFPEKSTNMTIGNNIHNEYVSSLEHIFSAPHGSVDDNGHMLSPEYDISLFKPYMISLNVFKSYYDVYMKYVNIFENTTCISVSDLIKGIVTKPFKHLCKIKETINHDNNHAPMHRGQICYPLQYFSQIEQDKYYIENIVNFKCNGVFLDIGAYDGITGSNTYFLEKYLNWTGVLVECNPYVIETCRSNRKSPVCDKAVFNNITTMNFVIPGGEDIIGGKQQLAGIETELRDESKHYFSKAYQNSEIVKVNTITMNDIFEKYNLSIVDYMSLDIEGGEFGALKDFNFEKYKILYIAVEHANIKSNQDKIYNLLISKGYKLVRNNKWDDEYMYSH